MAETLVEMLQRGESRARGYNDYNRFGPPQGDPRPFRGADRQIDFSQMTLSEIQAAQRLSWDHPDKLNAVGRYQTIRPTLQAAIREMDLGTNERFTPELQDRILVDYLLKEKRPEIHAYITGQPGASLREAQVAMANEWASVAHPSTGQSVYANNHGSLAPDQSAEALQNARKRYVAAFDRGMDPNDAWRIAAGLGQVHAQSHGHDQPSLAPNGVSSAPTPQHDLLKQGSEGPRVRQLQEALNLLGYHGADDKPLATDGDFGRNTDHAVREFQRARGLAVDGRVGPDTREALAEAAQRPLVSEAAHPNHHLFQAIARQLPEGADPRVTANITLQALENGITGPEQLKGVAVRGRDVHLQGPYPGARVSVDLDAPTPDLQAMSDHMARQTQEQQQRASRQQRPHESPVAAL